MGHGCSCVHGALHVQARLVLQRVYLALPPPVPTMTCASDSSDGRGGMDTVSVQPPVPPKVDTHATETAVGGWRSIGSRRLALQCLKVCKENRFLNACCRINTAL